MAWVIRNKDVSSAITGATKVSQIEDVVNAVQMSKKFTPEIDERIEKLLNNRPPTDFNFKTFQPFPPRR